MTKGNAAGIASLTDATAEYSSPYTADWSTFCSYGSTPIQSNNVDNREVYQFDRLERL
jgi:hypothetical protein